MAEQKFVRAPRAIPMVRWDGTNWPEVKAFFEARGWACAVLDGVGFVMIAGLLTGGTSGVPPFLLHTSSSAWLADVNDLHGQGYVPGEPGMIAFEVGPDGDPVGYAPA